MDNQQDQQDTPEIVKRGRGRPKKEIKPDALPSEPKVLKKRGPKPKPKSDDENKIKKKYYIKIPPELKQNNLVDLKDIKLDIKLLEGKKKDHQSL